MRAEWGSDDGIASFEEHRARVFKGFRALRDEIAAFQPDLIVIWGDDQYENFREDVIRRPPAASSRRGCSRRASTWPTRTVRYTATAWRTRSPTPSSTSTSIAGASTIPSCR
jgi:hypothetical protein